VSVAPVSTPTQRRLKVLISGEARLARRRRHRGGWGIGRGVPLPSRLEGLGECRKLHSGDRGGALAEIEFGKI